MSQCRLKCRLFRYHLRTDVAVYQYPRSESWGKRCSEVDQPLLTTRASFDLRLPQLLPLLTTQVSIVLLSTTDRKHLINSSSWGERCSKVDQPPLTIQASFDLRLPLLRTQVSIVPLSTKDRCRSYNIPGLKLG